VWFRGRTVVALMTLTMIVASVGTYAVLEFPGWSMGASGAKPNESGGFSRDELDKIE